MEQEEIKNKVNKISRENSIDVQAAWDILFFDEFLERLSKSSYKNRFVLKGGLYFSFSIIFDIKIKEFAIWCTFGIQYKYN